MDPFVSDLISILILNKDTVLPTTVIDVSPLDSVGFRLRGDSS